MQNKIINYYSIKSRQFLLKEDSLLEYDVINPIFKILEDLRSIFIELINGLYNDSIKLDMRDANKFYTRSLRTFVEHIENILTEFEITFIRNGYLPYYCNSINNIYNFTKKLRNSYSLDTNFLYDGRLFRFALNTYEIEMEIASTPFQKREIIDLKTMYKLLSEKGMYVSEYDNFETEFYDLASKGRLPLDLVTAKLFQHRIPFVLKKGANKLNWDFKLLKRYSLKRTFYIMGCIDSKIFKYGVSINDAMSRFKEHSKVAKYNGLPNFKLLMEFKTRNALNIEQYLNKEYIERKWSNDNRINHSLEWITLNNDDEVNYLLRGMWQRDEELKKILFFSPKLSPQMTNNIFPKIL